MMLEGGPGQQAYEVSGPTMFPALRGQQVYKISGPTLLTGCMHQNLCLGNDVTLALSFCAHKFCIVFTLIIVLVSFLLLPWRAMKKKK